ncbi:sulfotransferase domain-containing protein [Alkalihalobacillus sp. AL-G]|uniref:sulfotransferase domain-containing protein n=1 Tax=Alkalihalobacillus sp. AL-G TaxID=2926399 RepID=UPI00272B194C|nr:sulfotransferase domain-containing protein [Alkalihalobacillus sp. AL-G]WLD94951.1 sulfotransferase domain-containing protein [Alkalihalobacillus sp. AL-G]
MNVPVNHTLPPFLLNSIPKSGTHLLKQLLLGIPGIQHHPDKGMFGHYEYQTEIQINRARNLPNNEFINGHLYYSKKWEHFFHDMNMKQIFVIRDPRDVVISYAYFIPKLPIHPLYTTFTQKGFTHRDRIKFLIEGGQPTDPKKAYQPNVQDWFTSFSDWMDKDNVLTIRFEELLSSPFKKIQTVNKIIQFLWEDRPVPFTSPILVGKMIQNINPTTSPTYRKGKIGGWREEFDDELKRTFKIIAGDLLIALNYETNQNW